MVGEVGLQLLTELAAVLGGVEVGALPFNRAPEPLSEVVVGGAAAPVAADLTAGRQQCLLEGGTGELAALVGVEDVRGRLLAQCLGQRQQTKAHIERVGHIPTEHIARVSVRHGYQI